MIIGEIKRRPLNSFVINPAPLRSFQDIELGRSKILEDPKILRIEILAATDSGSSHLIHLDIQNSE